MNDMAPEYLYSLIRPKISYPSLRVFEDTTLLYEPPFEKQGYRNKRFEISAPRVWNELPRFLRELKDLVLFKSRLKTYLFNMF